MLSRSRSERWPLPSVENGYRSKKTFYRQFRALTGVTPARIAMRTDGRKTRSGELTLKPS